MSREHGFSDEDGHSLAPDLDDGLGLSLPVAVAPPVPSPLQNMAFGMSSFSITYEDILNMQTQKNHRFPLQQV